MDSSRLRKYVSLAVAAACLAAAAMLQRPVSEARQEARLVPRGDVAARNHPQLTVLTNIFGGLRAPIVAFLWIRAEAAHQEGSHYDALQLGEFICQLQPYSPGVWVYQAWQLAWNVSVMAHTPEERWLWVSNGMKLIRDRGIPLNPESLQLYRELAWIFYNKMGDNIDEMHRVYKQRWALQMQRLLGAPGPGLAGQAAEAFRPVAEAPLDKTLRRQGQRDRNGKIAMQVDQLGILKRDQAVARLIEALDGHGITVGWGLLDAYNTYTEDHAVSVTRSVPIPGSDKVSPLYKLINDKASAEARSKLLAFVRAQILWNEYRLDPAWMLRLMTEHFGAPLPLDWRSVQAHGLYWGTYGLDKCKPLDMQSRYVLNMNRKLLGCLKDLTLQCGRMTYLNNPENPLAPEVWAVHDPRFIAAAHNEHVRCAEQDIAFRKRKMEYPEDEFLEFKDNHLKGGHVNFLINVIQMLYAHGWLEEAQHYFDQLKELYDPPGDQYELPLKEFVLRTVTADGSPIAAVAVSQISGALLRGCAALSVGDVEQFDRARLWAETVWQAYGAGGTARQAFSRTLHEMAGSVLAGLMLEPRVWGYDIGLQARSRIYVGLGRRWPSRGRQYSPQMAAYYHMVRSRRLWRECERMGVRFRDLFPKPLGYEQFEQEIEQLRQEEMLRRMRK